MAFVVFWAITDFSKREGTEIESIATLVIRESIITFMCYLCEGYGNILTFIRSLHKTSILYEKLREKKGFH